MGRLRPVQSALRFLQLSLTRSFGDLVMDDHLLATGPDDIEVVAVHPPPRRDTGQAIVVINGFGIRGHRDPRILDVARTFATLGMTALIPAIAHLNRLEIHPDTITDIRRVLLTVTAHTDLCPSGRTALFVPSYTAGMALNACCHPSLAGRISAIMSVGTFAGIQRSLSFVLEQDDIDDYGRNILMKNFIHHALGRNEELDLILQVALEDNGYKRPPGERELPAVLDAVSPETRALWDRLDGDAAYRSEVLRTATTNMPHAEAWFALFDLDERIRDLVAPVLLLHGALDDVIPPGESERLHDELRAAGRPSHFLATRLLDHGDIQMGPTILGDAWRLFRAMRFFFGHTAG